MINRYKKGLRTQQKAKRWYESQGYEVEVVRYSAYMKNKDYFGLWDLICVGEYDIRFVQVKANNKPSKAWQAEAELWGPKGSKFIKEWVVYKDYNKGKDTPSTIVTLEPKS